MDAHWCRIRAAWAGMLAFAVVPGLPHDVRAADMFDSIHAEAGRQWYESYCTPCHGVGGAPGTAVFADSKKPVDLRDYVERSGGQFPAARWITVVTTENPTLVHTDVWNKIRKAQGSSVTADAAGRSVVASIASYVNSIQKK